MFKSSSHPSVYLGGVTVTWGCHVQNTGLGKKLCCMVNGEPAVGSKEYLGCMWLYICGNVPVMWMVHILPFWTAKHTCFQDSWCTLFQSLVYFKFFFHYTLFKVVGLNFSSATTPELLLKTFDHYCEYRRTPNGVVLAPVQLGKWLVLFCDEINLPDMDKYGTQRVISFIRQVCFPL